MGARVRSLFASVEQSIPRNNYVYFIINGLSTLTDFKLFGIRICFDKYAHVYIGTRVAEVFKNQKYCF